MLAVSAAAGALFALAAAGAGASSVARIPAGQALHVTVVLRPRDPGALSAYADSVSTPGSASYRRYLTPAQFARRFAPTRAVVASIRTALRARGLRAGALSANGLSLPVSANIGAIEHGFAISFERLALTRGREVLLPRQTPVVPARIARYVEALIGLDGLSSPEPTRVPLSGQGRVAATAPVAHATADAGPQACSAASTSASASDSYTANAVASSYGFDDLYRAGDEGTGVTVAIYELESYDPADIGTFAQCYGIDASVKDVPIDGGAGSGPGSGEAALDIEQVLAFAPKARILVYSAPNSNLDSPGSGPYDALSAIVSQDRAQVITNSWGECEPLEGRSDASAENVLLQEAAVQGQTFVTAAGDDGAQDCDDPPEDPDNRLEIDDPASQPFATGVGGTSLDLNVSPFSESVWNSNGETLGPGVSPGAGGGGISTLWPMPSYQSTAPAALNVIEPGISSSTPCAATGVDCREVPDVAADADPSTGYIFYYNGSDEAYGSPAGWQATGGTSAAAPLWAAVFALVDANASCLGRPIGFANPALYRLAGADEDRYFNDVQSGNNDFTLASGSLYTAGVGYDMASGLGSPNATALVGGLCPPTLAVSDPALGRRSAGNR